MLGVLFLMRPVRAALVVALGAEMFLPELVTLKVPFMPPLDKHNLPYLCILVACLLRCPRRVTRLPKERWMVVLALLMLVGGVITGLTNGDSLVFGPGGEVFIRGLNLKDGLYMGIAGFVTTLLPMYLGYALFRKREDLNDLIAALAIAGLVYLPFAMVELRMSPQWHRWIYGYAQHDFLQTIRWGGYRPMVFMSHGLALARFLLASVICLVILARARRFLFGLPIRLLAWTQFLVLVACKSTGAIVFALVGVPIVALVKPKRQVLVAALLAFAIVLYPALRSSGLFPVAPILEAAGAVQTDRADSLAFRFINEDALLARARQRIFFGWGEYDRNAIRDEAGRKSSVFDGYWIIRLSVNGIVGFIAAFGPLLIPVLWARRLMPSVAQENDQWIVAGMASLLTLLALDLIPNGLFAYYPYLIAGVLTRRLRELTTEARRRELEPEAG